MARTATITLDNRKFKIHAFNIGELEEASVAFEGPHSRVPYAILRIALRRAEPQLNGAFDSIEPTFDEISEAFQVIAKLSGLSLKEDEANPTKPAAS